MPPSSLYPAPSRRLRLTPAAASPAVHPRPPLRPPAPHLLPPPHLRPPAPDPPRAPHLPPLPLRARRPRRRPLPRSLPRQLAPFPVFNLHLALCLLLHNPGLLPIRHRAVSAAISYSGHLLSCAAACPGSIQLAARGVMYADAEVWVDAGRSTGATSTATSTTSHRCLCGLSRASNARMWPSAARTPSPDASTSPASTCPPPSIRVV